MADDEDGLIHAKERCNLLVKIKSTVDILLASNGSNVWSTYGGLARITDDLEHIFRHGLREIQGIFSDQNDYTTFLRGLKVLRPLSAPGSSSLQKNAVENSILNRGQAWIQQALLNHCLSSYVTMLVNNRQHLYECYYDFAFLRSKPHVEALCTCLKAVEKGNPGLLTQFDHALLDASRYVQLWLHRDDELKTSIQATTPSPEDLQFCGEEESLINEQLSNINEQSHSPGISIVYSDSGSSRDDIQSVLSTESPRDNQIEVCGFSEEDNTAGSDQMPPYSENFCYNPQDVTDEQVECLDDHVQANLKSTEGSGDFMEKREDGGNFSFAPRSAVESRSSEFDGEDVGRVRLVQTKKQSRVINKATLAQAALSAVLEIDEPNSIPGSPYGFHKALRRSSSLNDDLIRNCEANSSETLKGERGAISTVVPIKPAAANGKSDLTETDSFRRQPVASAISDHQKKRLIGHSRSKSEQIGMAKSKEQVVMAEPSDAKERRSGSFSSVHSRLASSLPAQSEYQYYNDPLISDPYEDQSYSSLLATQDFTSCELDKENAHFSISEALIAAIEQMKCDEVVASGDEDDDDDEEIQHLKQEIERRRIEKKQEKLRLQPAFSDGKSTSGKSSSISVASTASSLSADSNGDLSSGWEEITTVDEQFPIVADAVPRVSETTTAADHAFPDGSEFGQSPPLSAEAVAKSLLLKFANKKHPAASELHWLVSYQDAPQSLLPLPETVAVAPDDVPYDKDKATSPMQRRVSLPCRIRGNMEWAPPRPQIIFHVHGAPRRKTVMAQQNYRCGGCGMRVDPEFMKRFRYCNYLGKYFCSSCHNNALETIPARVVRKWDFRKYEVSEFARKLLLDIHSDPLFNIRDLNSSLYSRVKSLEETKDLRRQLHYFRNFARACRKARNLLKELETIPEHIFSDCHLYSMRDLLQVKSGEMPQYFKEIAKESLEHISQCQLCLAKGFICEYCKLDDIIFPFELKKAVQCSGCHASFHKECFVEGKCPKCERIRIRKNMLAEPTPTQESARSDGLELR